jgi:hypothetical protein
MSNFRVPLAVVSAIVLFLYGLGGLHPRNLASGQSGIKRVARTVDRKWLAERNAKQQRLFCVAVGCLRSVLVRMCEAGTGGCPSLLG